MVSDAETALDGYYLSGYVRRKTCMTFTHVESNFLFCVTTFKLLGNVTFHVMHLYKSTELRVSLKMMLGVF